MLIFQLIGQTRHPRLSDLSSQASSGLFALLSEFIAKEGFLVLLLLVVAILGFVLYAYLLRAVEKMTLKKLSLKTFRATFLASHFVFSSATYRILTGKAFLKFLSSSLSTLN